MMTTEPQLINLIGESPFFTYKNEGMEIKAYVAQSLYINEKYIVRSLKSLEKSSTSVIYLHTKIDTAKYDFPFKIPHNDKKFVNGWKKEEWVELTYLLHRQRKLMDDFTKVDEAVKDYQTLRETRKELKATRKQLKNEMKSADKTIQQFLTNIRNRENEKLVKSLK